MAVNAKAQNIRFIVLTPWVGIAAFDRAVVIIGINYFSEMCEEYYHATPGGMITLCEKD